MNNAQKKPHVSEWLQSISNTFTSTNGTLTAYDNSGSPITLEWQKIDPQSPDFNHLINKQLNSILAQTYTAMELDFAQKNPDLHVIAGEYFLQSLAPLFDKATDQIDWVLIEEKIKTIFQHFFATTDFTLFSGPQDVQLFVLAQDPTTDTILGCIQFLVTPDYAYGDIKTGFFGVALESHNRGLEKLLMSSIFKIIPTTKRIFLHTRSTNEPALGMYRDWGFTPFPGPLVNWTDMEYIAEKSNLLQE